MGKKGFYHLFSDGFRTDALFQDNIAFVAGMNIIALSYLSSKVKILAFILMDNHVHFILYGTAEDCIHFKDKFIHKFAMWHYNHNNGRYMNALEFDIKELADERYLLNSIAYVLRNGIAAGFAYCPDDYRWSSAGLYFRSPEMLESLSSKCVTVSELSVRERRRIMHSHTDIPSDWKVTPEGFIWPGSYVDYKLVENLYRTPRSFTFFMGQSKEEDINKSLGMIGNVTIPDMELRAKAIELSMEMFKTTYIRKLTVPNRLSLAKELRRIYKCSAKQIARIVHLEQMYVKEFM